MPLTDDGLVAAYEQLLAEHQCSADEIVCDPALRRRFLTLSEAAVGEEEEREALHRLLYLRKRKRLPRVR